MLVTYLQKVGLEVTKERLKEFSGARLMLYSSSGRCMSSIPGGQQHDNVANVLISLLPILITSMFSPPFGCTTKGIFFH